MTNPFATRFTRPGAIDFLFSDGESIESLMSRLQGSGWWGQIIGPHGSGKSTLVATLVPALEAAGRRIVRVTLNRGERRLPPGIPLTDGQSGKGMALLIVDGYEQLSWWSRWRLNSACRRQRAGLLVTAHADVGLPTIYRTAPSLELARRIVARLLPPDDAAISDDDIAAACAAHPDNLREALFQLFDLYQTRSAAARV